MKTGTHFRFGKNIGLLVALCAFIPSLAPAQQNDENSGADQRAVRGSARIYTPRLLNPDEGLAILGAALESRHPSESEPDCSHLVHFIYEHAGFTYGYANSYGLYDGLPEFRRITHPQPGDVVVWRGHVGIVISPVQRSFFSSMRSGRGVEYYDSPYWQKYGRPRFYRYIKNPSPVLSASAQSTYSQSNDSNASESLDSVPAEETLPQPVSHQPAGGTLNLSPSRPANRHHRFGIPPSLENTYQ